MTTTEVSIRQIIRADMPTVMKIELHSFQYPWTDEDFVSCLSSENVVGLVAESCERIAGFMIYEVIDDEFHLMNFAVSQDFRRQKVGTQLIGWLTSKMTSRRPTVRLECREKNLAAQKFFAKCGFKALEVVPEYYENPVEDAYRFLKFMR